MLAVGLKYSKILCTWLPDNHASVFSFYGESIVEKTESALPGFDFHPHMALLSGCHITPLEKPLLFLQDSAMFAGTQQFSLRHTNPVRLCVFFQVSFAKVPFPVISRVSSVLHLYHHNYKNPCQVNHDLNHPAAQALTIRLTHSHISLLFISAPCQPPTTITQLTCALDYR